MATRIMRDPTTGEAIGTQDTVTGEIEIDVSPVSRELAPIGGHVVTTAGWALAGLCTLGGVVGGAYVAVKLGPKYGVAAAAAAVLASTIAGGALGGVVARALADEVPLSVGGDEIGSGSPLPLWAEGPWLPSDLEGGALMGIVKHALFGRVLP